MSSYNYYEPERSVLDDLGEEITGVAWPVSICMAVTVFLVRVLNPTGEEAKKSRISLPLFLHPRPDVVLSERHTSGSYLQERLRELGVKK